MTRTLKVWQEKLIHSPLAFGNVIIVLLCGLYALFNWGNIELISTDYEEQINSITKGRPFLKEDGELLMNYPPVVPYIFYVLKTLARTIGVSEVWTLLPFTILCFNLTYTFLYKTVKLLGFNRVQLWLFFILSICNPFLLKFLLVQYSEPLYLVFFSISLLFAVKLIKQSENQFKDALILGLFFGLGLLTRPISLFMPLLFCITLIFFFKNLKNRFGLSIIIMGITILTTVPWQLFAGQHSEDFNFLSSRGMYGIRDGLSLNFKESREPFEFSENIDAFLWRFQKDYYSYQKTSEIGSFLWTEFQNDPITVIHYYLIKVGRSWYGTDMHRIKTEKFILALMLPWIILYIFSLFHLKKVENKNLKFIVLFLVFSTLSIWALNAISSSLVRYMVPLMVFNAIPISIFLADKLKLNEKFASVSDASRIKA